MDWYWFPIALLLGVAIGIGLFVLRDWLKTQQETEAAADARHALGRPQPQAGANILVRAPMVNGVTLKTWLIHEHPSYQDVWGQVVDDFYTTAAQNPAIAKYFLGTIEDGRFDRLKKHFLATLLILVDKGLTDRTVAALRDRHANMDIRPEDFDATIQVLVQTLRTYRVRYSTIEELVPAVNILRRALVKEPAK